MSTQWEKLAQQLILDWTTSGGVQLLGSKSFADELADWLAANAERDRLEDELSEWLLDHANVDELFLDEIELRQSLALASHKLAR